MPVPLEPVDSVEITVLVDNATDSLSSVPGFVRHEWPNLMRAGMRELSGECQCCANHGLALVVTARRGAPRARCCSTPGRSATRWSGTPPGWGWISAPSAASRSRTATGTTPAG